MFALTNVSFWISATRSLPGTFHLLLLLGAGGFILLQKRRTLHKVMAAQKAQSEVVPPAPKLDLNLPEQ